MITEEQLDQIGGMVSQQTLSEEVVGQLRQQFEGIHFTYCSDDDIAEAKPIREAEGFNLYLVDGSNHCLCFTPDMQVATGIVVAEIEDEYATMPTEAADIDLTPKADCSVCPHRRDRLTSGRCVPGDTCVMAMSGRQIARFFNVNPDLADLYAGDEFWERRAIAARYLSQQRLLQMLDDPDEVVRRVLAYRLPVDELNALITDPDREVRVTVADRLPANELEQMAMDEDYLVRQYVAKRMKRGRLFRMIADTDSEVRKTVARRLPEESLGLMLNDSDAEIRRTVAERIGPESLAARQGERSEGA